MNTEVKLLKLPEVLALTKKSRTSTLAAVRKGEFPAPINIGNRAVAWLASEVNAWIEQRAKARLPNEQREGEHV
jgi:prophage regulatory protein